MAMQLVVTPVPFSLDFVVRCDEVAERQTVEDLRLRALETVLTWTVRGVGTRCVIICLRAPLFQQNLSTAFKLTGRGRLVLIGPGGVPHCWTLRYCCIDFA